MSSHQRNIYKPSYTYIRTLYPRRDRRSISDITPRRPRNYLATRSTAELTGGKPIAVRSQYISDVCAVNSLVAFYDVHGRKGEVLFFCSVPDTTRETPHTLSHVIK
jgi:hypothetical protein